MNLSNEESAKRLLEWNDSGDRELNELYFKQLQRVKNVQTSFLTPDELAKVGFFVYGKNVLVSRYACIYNARDMVLGNDIRIDDFVTLSGSITLHGHNHIGAGAQLFGSAGINVGLHSQISMQATLLSASDDFQGKYLVGPTYRQDQRGVYSRQIEIADHCIVAVKATLMPGVTLHEGAIAAAHAFVKDDIPEWEIHGGIPAKFISSRYSTDCKRLL